MKRFSFVAVRCCVLAVSSLSALSAHAQSADSLPTDAPTKIEYGIGLASVYSPEYEGSDRYKIKLRPLLVLQYGRFRFTGARSGAILDRSGVGERGASADLINYDRWRASASLRIDSGRQSSDSAYLAGLPNIKQTVRGKLLVAYQWADQHRFDASIAQDLLGRGGGAIAGFDWKYLQRINPATEWFVNAGVTAADKTSMQTNFGVQAGTASTLPVFTARSGLRDVHLVSGLRYAINQRWMTFGNVETTTLLGSAANSPLTKVRHSGGLTIGVAYRCCGA